MTRPESGNASGSHGERLSARWRSLALPAEFVFGPVVVIVTVTVWGDEAPWAIALKPQVMVVSGRPLQAKVTASANVVAPPVAVTIKVDVVASPASTGTGVVGVDKVNVGALMV